MIIEEITTLRKLALPIINNYAAGIDIGATSCFVAVPSDNEAGCVRRYPTFTEDLIDMALWLKECGVTTVAMESTGVYWIPVFDVLQDYGLHVNLVNAHYAKNVPGRKSDVRDSRWLQTLHSFGLLSGSFHPDNDIRSVRAIMRHRENLISDATSHVQHMQKALVQMNIRLHDVISDITGVSGLSILDAILAGVTDPEKLADMCDCRIRAPREKVVKSLHGNYRREQMFVLRQSREAYAFVQTQIAAADKEVEAMMAGLESRVELPPDSDARPDRPKRTGTNDLRFEKVNVATEMHRIVGVDLTAVPGIGPSTVQMLISEVGQDLSAFPTHRQFTSWLGLCPMNKITGEKVISSHTRRVKSRFAGALRMCAQVLSHSKTPLGDYYRKVRFRQGPKAANTATAHKLARIIYYLVTTGEKYDPALGARELELQQERRKRKLQKDATALGYTLVPTLTPA